MSSPAGVNGATPKSASASPGGLEWTEPFSRAFDLMENSSRSLFITGKAGTGKSTLLQYFRDHTNKEMVVLAPTGVAAVNIRGQTIHSFFRFKPDITPEKVNSIRLSRRQKALYKKIDALVIDEISMVRADLLDAVDSFLRLHGKSPGAPFGGLQLIAIGDLYQLPPVVTSRERDIFRSHYPSPYFFDANVFKSNGRGPAGIELELVELEKIYRQKDDVFIGLLNAIRNNSIVADDLKLLETRLQPGFKPKRGDFFIYLTTKNDMADTMNEERLRELPSRTCRYEGQLDGEFDRKNLPTQEILELKEGAQVMLLNNHPKGFWVNGTIGIIKKIHKHQGEPDSIEVTLADGSTAWVGPYTWEMFHTTFNAEQGRLESETIGSFTQYPLRLAWAVTIHKSQGKTFPRVIVDIGAGAFSHGQVYVALSRCTSLEGLVLIKPILKRHIFMDWRVVRFMTQFQYRLSDEALPLKAKTEIVDKAIHEKKELEIIYLKSNDEKSRRRIRPEKRGKMEYMGKAFEGLEAYCFERKEIRVFRIDRILKIF